MYSLTDLKSVQTLPTRIDDLCRVVDKHYEEIVDSQTQTMRQQAVLNAPWVIVGNKTDLQGRMDSHLRSGLLWDRHSTTIRQWSGGSNFASYHISTKSSYNFDKPFLFLLRQLSGFPDLEMVPNAISTSAADLKFQAISLKEDEITGQMFDCDSLDLGFESESISHWSDGNNNIESTTTLFQTNSSGESQSTTAMSDWGSLDFGFDLGFESRCWESEVADINPKPSEGADFGPQPSSSAFDVTSKFTPEECLLIEEAWDIQKPSREVLAWCFWYNLTRQDLLCLKDNGFLSEVILSPYFQFISSPRVYSMNVFFYPMFSTMGYLRVERWFSKVDLFSYEKVLIPIHLNHHWGLAVLNNFVTMSGKSRKEKKEWCFLDLPDSVLCVHLEQRLTTFKGFPFYTMKISTQSPCPG